MSLGYAATASRDYPTALVNFRRALTTRPGDRYATTAVTNVTSYLNAGGDSTISFVDPNRGAPAPGNRQGGATRGGCSSKNQSLTALVPATNLGTTTAEYPALFFYVPKTSVQTPLEFALLDQNDSPIYKTNIAPKQAPGIVKVSFSNLKGVPRLESGKNYHWYLSIICDPQDRSADIAVDGWIKRIQPDPALANELQQTKPGERVPLYEVGGVWYDTVAALAETRQSNPNNSALADEWAGLLKAVGLDKIAREPIVQ
jgi:hypothetical protein